MGESYDLNHGPLVLVQVRWKLAFALLGCLGFVVVGVVLFPSRPAIDKPTMVGALCIGVFGFFGILATAALIRPGRLTIDQRGLILQTPFRTRFWPWPDILQINLIRVRMTDTLSISTQSATGLSRGVFAAFDLPGNAGLPGGWPIRMKALHALLVGAKARWG